MNMAVFTVYSFRDYFQLFHFSSCFLSFICAQTHSQNKIKNTFCDGKSNFLSFFLGSFFKIPFFLFFYSVTTFMGLLWLNVALLTINTIFFKRQQNYTRKTFINQQKKTKKRKKKHKVINVWCVCLCLGFVRAKQKSHK